MKPSLAASPGLVRDSFDRPVAGSGTRAAVARPGLRLSWLDRLEGAICRARQREVDRFVGSAVDSADFEARLSRFERRR